MAWRGCETGDQSQTVSTRLPLRVRAYAFDKPLRRRRCKPELDGGRDRCAQTYSFTLSYFTIPLVARTWLPHRLTAGSAVVQVMTAVRAHRTKCCKRHKDHIRKYLGGSRDSCPLDKEGIPKPDLAEDQLEGACRCVSVPSLASA